MKNYRSLLFILIITVLSSCEKVIDIDLNESDKQYVIEASLEEGENDFSVLITKTAPYFDNQPSDKITTAKVTLKDITTGESIDVPHLAEGKYQTVATAEKDHVYQLSVDVEGKNFTATSSLPKQIPLTEVYSEKGVAGPPRPGGEGEEKYSVYFRYNDPADEDNYYRAIHYINGKVQLKNIIQVWDDNVTNGQNARFPLFGQSFDAGDTVLVQLIHYDDISYDYFNSLSDLIGSGGGPGGTAAPGNPNSNWSNNALGYFSAYSADTLSVVVGTDNR